MLLSSAALFWVSLLGRACETLHGWAHHMLHFPPHLPKDQNRLSRSTSSHGSCCSGHVISTPTCTLTGGLAPHLPGTWPAAGSPAPTRQPWRVRCSGSGFSGGWAWLSHGPPPCRGMTSVPGGHPDASGALHQAGQPRAPCYPTWDLVAYTCKGVSRARWAVFKQSSEDRSLSKLGFNSACSSGKQKFLRCLFSKPSIKLESIEWAVWSQKSVSVFYFIRKNHNVLYLILNSCIDYLSFLKYMCLVNFAGDVLGLYGDDFKLSFKNDISLNLSESQ